MLHDEILKAIGAHGMWKSRLRRAIDRGTSEFTAETVRVDDQCDFGRWLHALKGPARSAPQFQRVLALHADFHREAAAVLQLVTAGKKSAADQAIAQGSKFDHLTTDLTRAMMEWDKAA